MRITLCIKNIVIFFLVVPVIGLGQTQKLIENLFDTVRLKEHIVRLASDSFQGRRPFTLGETRTIQYITTQLKTMGVEPGNGHSYLDEVVTSRTTYISPVIQVQSPTGDFILQQVKDFAVWTASEDTMVSFQKSQVVFVGYGIVAPEYNRDDYAGIDVKGKIVLVLLNEENQKESFMDKSKPVTHYESLPYKLEEAARQGATGCFLVPPVNSSFPFQMIQSDVSEETLHQSGIGQCAVMGAISRESLKKLFNISRLDSNILKQPASGIFKPIVLNLSFTTHVQAKSEYRSTANIIARIAGTNHPDETIIYSAHWDHLGIGPPDYKGDSIFHGANDDALGVAIVLELAQAFKNLKSGTDRSIVFLFFTGEEMGRWGSQWYTGHPVFPLIKTVADFNIDGFNRFGRTRNIELVGSGNSTLEDDLAIEVEKQGRYITPDDPRDSLYFRSDHFSFAQAGVPALWIGRGKDYLNGGNEYEKVVTEKYWAYHTPSDKINEGWRFDGTIEDMELIFNIGKKLANNRVWPQWKPLSAFKSIQKGK